MGPSRRGVVPRIIPSPQQRIGQLVRRRERAPGDGRGGTGGDARARARSAPSACAIRSLGECAAVERLLQRVRHPPGIVGIEQEVHPGPHRLHRRVGLATALQRPVHDQRVGYDQTVEAERAAQLVEQRLGERGRESGRIERRIRHVPGHDRRHPAVRRRRGTAPGRSRGAARRWRRPPAGRCENPPSVRPCPGIVLGARERAGILASLRSSFARSEATRCGLSPNARVCTMGFVGSTSRSATGASTQLMPTARASWAVTAPAQRMTAASSSEASAAGGGNSVSPADLLAGATLQVGCDEQRPSRAAQEVGREPAHRSRRFPRR